MSSTVGSRCISHCIEHGARAESGFKAEAACCTNKVGFEVSPGRRDDPPNKADVSVNYAGYGLSGATGL